MLRRVPLVRTDVSEESSIKHEPHGLISQKKAFFIVTAMKTSLNEVTKKCTAQMNLYLYFPFGYIHIYMYMKEERFFPSAAHTDGPQGPLQPVPPSLKEPQKDLAEDKEHRSACRRNKNLLR
jgi:hypothetical protein